MNGKLLELSESMLPKDLLKNPTIFIKNLETTFFFIVIRYQVKEQENMHSES